MSFIILSPYLYGLGVDREVDLFVGGSIGEFRMVLLSAYNAINWLQMMLIWNWSSNQGLSRGDLSYFPGK